MRFVIWILALWIVVVLGYLAYSKWWPSSSGTLVVISEPPGAQVWVDLNPTNVTTNGTVHSLSDGQHSVTVKLDTLLPEPFAHVVHVRRGRVDTLHFVLYSPGGQPVQRQAATELSPPSMSRSVAERDSALHAIPSSAELRAPASEQGATPDKMASTETSARVEYNPDVTPALPALPADDPTINWRPDLNPTSTLPAFPVEQGSAQATTPDEGGVIQITSSEPGARIIINDHERDERTPASVTVPFGTYTIQVELKGYTVSPDQQSVRISRASSSPTVHFTLREQVVAIRAFSVQTEPVEGRIFVDKIFVGEGSAACERDYGTYEVTFGEVDGWRAPKPVRVTLTPAKPQHEIHARYSRLYHAFAQANGEKSVGMDGFNRWSTGVIFETGDPLPSELLGSKIREIPGSKKFGWELAMGDPNRNPTGGDYVIFSFTLPEDVAPDSPLSLRLYAYRSSRNYPFTITGGRSEIVVEVNGRRFLDGFSPRFETYAADLDRYEEWSLTRVLKSGENRIMIYSGDGNKTFNYLWKIEIL